MKVQEAGLRAPSVGLALGALCTAATLLSGCGAADLFAGSEFFSESSMGVGASPRVTTSRNVPKGGGRYQVGEPYTVAGNTFVPREQPNLDVTGKASWYGPAFHGRLTANGEVYDMFHLSGAHPTLPLPSYVRVTNVDNGVSTIVRVNDRGPFSHERVIDLSRRTAEVLGFKTQGTANVRVQYVGPAPLQGDDTRFLVASINQLTPYEINSGTRMAYEPVQVAQAEAPAPPSALDAANTAAAPQPELPFQLLSYSAALETSGVTEPFGSAVHMQLGTFNDAEQAQELARRFALLGAVDTTTITAGDQVLTQLSLRHFREGVTAADANDMAASLGLEAPISY